MPYMDITAPLSNYALAFFRSGGAFATVLRETGLKDSELYECLVDWSCLLHGLRMVVAATNCRDDFKAAVTHLAMEFSEQCRKNFD
jgi:hypothetical protein